MKYSSWLGELCQISAAGPCAMGLKPAGESWESSLVGSTSLADGEESRQHRLFSCIFFVVDQASYVLHIISKKGRDMGVSPCLSLN